MIGRNSQKLLLPLWSLKPFVCTIGTIFSNDWTSLVAQMIKRLPTMQKTRVQSIGQEDLLEKEMATPSSILAWKIPWTEEPVGYSPWGRRESDTTE